VQLRAWCIFRIAAIVFAVAKNGLWDPNNIQRTVLRSGILLSTMVGRQLDGIKRCKSTQLGLSLRITSP
jgi:hypothetical protein